MIKEKIKKIINKTERLFKNKHIKNTIVKNDDLYKYSPEVVLYLSGRQSSAYQGNMWLEVLEKLDAKVAVVLRDYNIIFELHKTSLPVFIIESFDQLELLEKAGVKTILYPANPMKVTQSLRLHRLNHYFINHGESDKVVNQSKLLMAYDKLLVAGPMAKRRLLEAKLPLRDNQVVYVGRPQVELFLDQTKPQNVEIKHILYAPTWEGFVEEANYSSINEYGLILIEELAKVSDRINIYFKPHPFTAMTNRGKIKEYFSKINNIAKTNNIILVDSSESIHKYMNMADLMITDISSIISDFLYTKKPMILTNTHNEDHMKTHKEYPSSKALYILDQPEKTIDLIDEITKNDYLRTERYLISNDILGDIPEGYMNKFNRIINESL